MVSVLYKKLIERSIKSMAKWIKACVGYGNAYRMCSDCKEVIYLPLDYKYCPMCGTKMEEVKIKNYNVFEYEE
jgi:rRNA maturation endonuclease Nob1